MNIIVLYPKIAFESARELAHAIDAESRNPFEWDQRDFRIYDVVLNYGCHRDLRCKEIINTGKAVGICKNKIETFKRLKEAGVPCPEYATRKQDVPKHWGQIVIRDSVDGARAEGLDYRFQGEPLPDAPLYVQYFPHKYEYRIMVFKGKVVGRYHKVAKKDGWHFILMNKQGFEKVDKDCIKAAESLGIDYVGFDVLENKKGECIILEANSAPILTDEALKAIKKYFK